MRQPDVFALKNHKILFMPISQEHFIEFKRIFKEEFGEDEYNKMSNEQLYEEAIRLITLMEAVYRHKNSKNN